MNAPEHPKAAPPERQYWIPCRGVRLRAHEWGDPEGPPVLLCHGAFDHAHGFDMLAPLLAERFRVISLDARGHGDSEWVDAYMWTLDVMDIVMVLRFIDRPTHLVGHSKGGGQATEAAVVAGDRVRQLVNMDGFGPLDDNGFSPPGAAETVDLSFAERCALFLDRRRAAKTRLEWAAHPSLDDLVARRGRQNPRLDPAWLRYFVYYAARESEDGWRWKVDPQMVMGGFGPFKTQWIAPGWTPLSVPMLALIGSVADHWGPLPEEILEERLGYVPDLTRATVKDSGHFLHMEQPDQTARLILEFLDR